MNYYVIAMATCYGETLPRKYWWGPFTLEEATRQAEDRSDVYPIIAVVKKSKKILNKS